MAKAPDAGTTLDFMVMADVKDKEDQEVWISLAVMAAMAVESYRLAQRKQKETKNPYLKDLEKSSTRHILSTDPPQAALAQKMAIGQLQALQSCNSYVRAIGNAVEELSQNDEQRTFVRALRKDMEIGSLALRAEQKGGDEQRCFWTGKSFPIAQMRTVSSRAFAPAMPAEHLHGEVGPSGTVKISYVVHESVAKGCPPSESRIAENRCSLQS